MLRIVLGVVLVGVTAELSAQSHTTTLLILNKDDATLAILDPVSRAVLAKVGTGEGPHEVIASTDGTLAFVSNYGSQTPGSSISVIDLVARKELRRVDVSPLRRPHGLAFADGKLYFTAEVNRILARYDPGANRIDWMIGTGQATTHMVMVNRDATRAVTTNIGSNSLAFFDRGANPLNWTETVVPVGRGPEGADWSPDGREIWAANSQDGTVSIVDVATRKVSETLDLKTRRSNRLKFTPDGKTVLISDLDAGDLLVVDVATHKEIRRLHLGRGLAGILIQPDGARAYVAATDDNEVAVVDLKTWAIIARIAGAGPDGMDWVSR